MNVISEIQRINNLELSKGITHTSASWHTKYKDSAWINVGNLPLNLTEGDVICIFSQYGEIDDVNLVRDKDSGKSRGFAFVKYEDARSCVLAVDNLCGSVVLGRNLRVDHVERYRLPKHVREREDEKIKNGERNYDHDDNDETDGSENKKERVSVAEAGHAYKGQELASSYNIHAGQDLFAAPPKKMGSDDQRQDLTDEKNSNNIGGDASTTHHIQHKDMDKAERRRRKEERAQKRREKEEYRRKKEERKRRKHHDGQHDRRRKEDKRRRSRSDSN